jgi:flavin reductase (DIM6/NTAB) family NADH-FMN oxidoreductase RutF
MATGAPLIDGALAWVECAVVERVPAGDHTVLLGRVLSLDCAVGAEPLTFFAGSFGTVAAGQSTVIARALAGEPRLTSATTYHNARAVPPRSHGKSRADEIS